MQEIIIIINIILHSFSPGDTVGFTDCDWQTSGSMDHRVLTTPTGGYHFAWTGNYFGRWANYNYYHPPSYWLGPSGADGYRLGGIAQLADGRAALLLSGNTLLIDAAEGAGTFTAYDLPDDSILWDRIHVDNMNYIYVSGDTDGDVFIIYSTDEGITWSNLIHVDSTDLYYSKSWTGFNGEISLLYNSSVLDILYYESTDHGVNWNAATVFAPPPEDSVIGYLWFSGCYDNAGNLHVAFTCIDTMPGGGSASSGWRAQIRHWNQQTGQISLVDNGLGWVTSSPGPGALHPTVSEPQVTIDRTTGDLYCTWCYADPADVAANGLVNMDIWGAKSTDNGTTWIEHHNITNSPTPGAEPGFCDNDHVNDLAEETLDDTLIMFYLNDKDAGFACWYPPDPGALPTDNPLLFYLYKWNPPGIQESDAQISERLSLEVTPNPVSHNAKLTYALPYSTNVSLRLYGIDGRLVRIFVNGRKNAGIHEHTLDCAGLANGIYFITLKTASANESRVLTVIH